jgi:hypothetical protein
MGMRAVKHKLKPLTVEQNLQCLALFQAYQSEKNYWSDQLLNGSNHEVNLKNLSTYRQIRDHHNLTKNNYISKYRLPIRYCTIALKEAYDLHIRTYESQIALIKKEVNNKIYKFKLAVGHVDTIGTVGDTGKSNHTSETNQTHVEQDSHVTQHDHTDQYDKLNIIKTFLYFVTNSLFYNYKTFKTFEEDFYSKKFKRSKAKPYQRIQPILKDFLKKAIDKNVFKQDATKNNEQQLQESLIQLDIFFKTINLSYETSDTDFSQLFYYYCNCLVKAIVKFRNFKPIQSQINPTITLDSSCYELYSVYDSEAKKNRWFLDITSMEFRKRIKGLELTGFHHAKKIMKRKKYANLVLSFDSTEIADGSGFYAHFIFDAKPIKKTGSFAAYSSCGNAVNEVKKASKSKKRKSSTINETDVSKNKPQLATLPTIGGDFGLTESFTFSDGWVSGRKQGKVLSYIANSTKDSVTFLQKRSAKGFFGVEKNNKTGKRNHKNNCFNHNQLLGNINESYRKKQQKHNRFLQNYKYLLVNEIIEHFTSDSVYGQYANATHENPIQLVFEDLDYTNLGFDANQKRQINLIKGILNVLEEKINRYDLPSEIIYVHPGYTSQNCPNCYFVAKANRNSAESNFRCQHCGFTAIDDERYEGLTRVIPEKLLPSADDFIASRNIAMRLSTIPDSTRLRLRDIKYRLMQKHESVKVSCKIFTK